MTTPPKTTAQRQKALRTHPDPSEIRNARGCLTQTAAAELIGKALKTWQNWEAPTNSPEHRRMDPALFELFKIKLEGRNNAEQR